MGFSVRTIIARIGGDEFAILFPDTDAETAVQFIMRVRQKLAEECLARPDLPLAISIGVATAVSENLESTFQLADERMYADKRARKQNT